MSDDYGDLFVDEDAPGYALPVGPESVDPMSEEAGADVVLLRLSCDGQSVADALRTWGVTAKLGRPFACVLPGHDEEHPSASVFLDPQTRVWRYRDWHKRSGPEWLSLAEVRASRAYGVVRRLRAPEASRWYLRLFWEAGHLEPVDVEMPWFPDGVPPAVRIVAEGFRLLLGLRWLRGFGEPTVFTRKFAAAWCEVSEQQARDAIAQLRQFGVIQIVGTTRVGSHDANLYLPGERGRSA